MKHYIYGILIVLLASCSIFKDTKKPVKTASGKEQKNSFNELKSIIDPFFEGLILYEQERYKEARSEFEKSIAKGQKFAPAHYFLAKACWELKDFNCYSREFKNAYELNPENKWYALEYAEVLKQDNQYNKALEILRKVYDKNPKDLNLLIKLINLYIQAGKFDEALSLLDVLEKRGMEREVGDQRIRILLQQGNITDAIEEAKRLAKKNPSEMLWLQHIVNLYSFLGEEDSVKHYLKEMLKINQDYLFALKELINLSIKTGDYNSAKKYIRQVIHSKSITPHRKMNVVRDILLMSENVRKNVGAGELLRELLNEHPNEPSVLILYGDYLNSLNQKDSSLYYYKKALSLDDASPVLWEQIINMESELGRYDSVAKYSEKALEVFPEQVSFMYNYALALIQQKKYKQAERYLRKIEKIGTSDNSMLLSVYLMLGETYHYLGDYEKSNEYFEKAIKKFPENPTALNNYAYFLSLKNQNLDKAEELIKKVIQNYPNIPAYLDTYGWILFKQGKYKEALKYIEKAYELSQNPDPEIIEHLGDVHLKLNNIEKALQYWNEAYKKTKSDEIYKKIRKYSSN